MSKTARMPANDGSKLVLFVYGDVTARKNGAHFRICELIAFCAQHFGDVSVYSYRSHPAEPWTDAAQRRFAVQFPDVELCLDNPGKSVRLLTKIKNILIPLFPAQTERFLRWYIPGATPRLDQYRRSGERIAMFVNYVDGLTWLNGVSTSKTIIESHDVKSLKFARRYGKSPISLKVLAKLRGEIAMLGTARVIVAIGAKDAEFFQAYLPESNTLYIPSYDLTKTTERPFPEKYVHDLLFVGSNNQFNVDGLSAFLDRAKSWISNYSLAIAGQICEIPIIKAAVAEFPNIQLLGFVPDLGELYHLSKAVISPVDGTGLKIKVVEAFAHGRPVFATPHSFEGLPPGFSGCLFPLEEKVVAPIIDDPQLLAAAQHRAFVFHQEIKEAGDKARLVAIIEQLLTTAGMPGRHHNE